MGRTTKRKLYLRKRNFFVIGKYVEDAKQVTKHVPGDPLESMLFRPTDPLKEELRQTTMKMNQFRHKTTKSRVSTLRMSGKSTDSCQRPIPAFSHVSSKQQQLPKTLINQKNAGFLASASAFYTSFASVWVVCGDRCCHCLCPREIL